MEQRKRGGDAGKAAEGIDTDWTGTGSSVVYGLNSRIQYPACKKRTMEIK